MMIIIKRLLFVIILTNQFFEADGQFLMDMVDTSTVTGRGMLSIYKKFDGLRLSGYIQPQWQFAEQKGITSFDGGDFPSQVTNRMMLRRSRVRIDYVHFNHDKQPGTQVVFQFDANERGFTIRDVWGRITENNLQLFSFTTGMFARPFGYEINLSSSDRESTERGRMSQLFMKSERDLGAMLSFDVRKKQHPLKYIKVDAGFFNGQGITANGDFDNIKDFIGRISLKPVSLNKSISFSGGLSILSGGLMNNTRYVYTTGTEAGIKKQLLDSSITNSGKTSPRKYYGADAQLKIKNKKGFTELRAEIMMGTQTGTALTSETPVSLLSGENGFYQRKFSGGYFYFLQNIFSVKHQLVLKYDFLDPNIKVARKEIGVAGSNFSPADIKYNTIGLGYINYLTDNVKLVLFYTKVFNEITALNGFSSDINDDIFTCRLQFRF